MSRVVSAVGMIRAAAAQQATAALVARPRPSSAAFCLSQAHAQIAPRISSMREFDRQIPGTSSSNNIRPVMKMMKATPINDLFAHNGRIREDGRMVHDMYLFEVKKPSESKEPWDDYRLVATIPAEEAFQPLSQSTCPLIKK